MLNIRTHRLVQYLHIARSCILQRKILGVLLLVSAAINVSLITHVFYSEEQYERSRILDPLSYPYLSPRIFVYSQNDLLVHFVSLRAQLNEYQKQKGNNLAIYFEYLPTGTSIGVNEKEEYVFASLLKVPVIMAAYKRIESGEMSKDTILSITAKDLDPYFGDLWKKGEGTKITVQEAIELSLERSDNTANNALFHAMPPGSLEDVFDSLDIPKVLTEKRPVVTPKNYTSILRSLYLSSYNSIEHSNEILYLLSKSPFDDKLRVGVPDTVRVSHKIGVYEPNNPNKTLYTDCGIVYVPSRPYSLCIMARTDEQTASSWMKDVSSMIYSYVENY